MRLSIAAWFYLLAFCFAIPALAVAEQKPLPAYSTDSIWLFEQMKSPRTVPYNGATTVPGATVYFGTIRNTDGTPAAGAEFYARMTPQVSGRVQVMTGSVLMTAGKNGRFRFALKGFSSNGIFMAGGDANGRWTRSQEEFSLIVGKENIIISRLKMDLPVHLMLANGREMGKTDVPVKGRDFLSKSSIGTCNSLPPGQPYSDGELYFQKSGVANPFIIRSLAVPGRYSLLAMGRVFKPFSVETTQSEVTLYEDARPFVLRGEILGTDGNPVKDAIIIVDNASAVNQQLLTKPFQSAENLWNDTLGDFKQLGFYMARTNDAGKYEIRGNCLTDFANLYAFADGFGVTTIANFLPEQSTGEKERQISTGLFKGGQIWNSHKNYSKRLFSGEADVPPVTIARIATLNIQVMNSSGLLKDSDWISAYIIADKLKADNASRRSWLVNTEWTPSGGQFSVPAGIPFKLVLKPRAKRNDTDVILITNPLKPGEVRNLGKHTLNLTPAKPNSR